MTDPTAPSQQPPDAPGDFAREWERATTGLTALHDALRRELDAAWQEVADLLAEQTAQVTVIAPDIDRVTPATHPATRSDASRTILLDSLDHWDRQRPARRAQRACERYHLDAVALSARLAPPIAAIGPEFLAPLASDANLGLSRWLLGKRRAPFAVRIGTIVASALAAAEPQQLGIEARLLVVFARAGQLIRHRWEDVRSQIDGALDHPSGRAMAKPSIPIDGASELATTIAALRHELDATFAAVLARAARDVVRIAAWHLTSRGPRDDRRRARYADHWNAQLSALDNELRFERRQDAFERNLLTVGADAFAALEEERAALLREMEVIVRALDDRLQGTHCEIPNSGQAVVPAAGRSAELNARVTREFEALPAEIELLRRLDPSADDRVQLRAIAPAQMATTAFERMGQPAFDTIFLEIQQAHVGLVQDIERALQVVDFASETRDTADDLSVNHEALSNARMLLTSRLEEIAATLPDTRDHVGTTLAAIFNENRLLLTRSRLGVLAHLGRLGFRQAFARTRAAAMPTLRAGGQRSVRSAGKLWRRALVAIQWVPAGSGQRLDVIRRPYLPQEFTLDPREKELPAIYRRLFRVEAVSDPRFLVGRDREMQALTEARAFWEAGRPVATLVIGERGSGKTSLINCALAGPLAGLPLLRSEFNARIATADGVRAFLAHLVGSDPADLETTLRSERRVIVLEETERIFLREMAGFDGVGELQRLIAATSGTTLWMVVTNQAAFRFLDAAVKFGASFSHRINAASASPEAVRDAILVRHHLSGLRLRFTAPPSQRGVFGRLRRRIRGDGDPEQLFFASLARESAGVFRTAFELWLGQIDAVEGSTMVLKPLLAPDIDAVINQLDADDLFTFVAIKQHGSLTPDEHAAVFRRTPAASRAELDDLLVREIIEPEPGRPGFRIRPGALRVVREALHRRNLG